MLDVLCNELNNVHSIFWPTVELNATENKIFLDTAERCVSVFSIFCRYLSWEFHVAGAVIRWEMNYLIEILRSVNLPHDKRASMERRLFLCEKRSMVQLWMDFIILFVEGKNVPDVPSESIMAASRPSSSISSLQLCTKQTALGCDSLLRCHSAAGNSLCSL